MVTGSWAAALDRLLAASTPAEAQMATVDVIDEALPGGSAVVDDGAALVRTVNETERVTDHPFRAHVLWILVLLRRWAGVWQAAASSRTAGPRTRAAAAYEQETAQELERSARVFVGMIHDVDPEVRSMAYRLVGSALPPHEAIEALIEVVSGEASALARACGVEAVAIAAVRAWPDVPEGVMDWLRNALTDDLTRGRIRHLQDGRAIVNRGEAIEVIVGGMVGDVASLPEEGPFWPVESI